MGSFEDRAAFVTGLEQARRMLDAAVGHTLAEMDRRGECEAEVGVSTGAWYAEVAGVPRGVAKARVATARKLGSVLTGTGEALTEGRISYEQARVIADAANPRIAEQIAGMEHEWIDLVDEWSFERFRREVAGALNALDEDGGYDPVKDRDADKLSFVDRPDGVTDLRGTLVGEAAVLARSAIDSKADELFRRYTHDHGKDPSIVVPCRSALLAEAMVELLREAEGVDLESSKPPRVETTMVVKADDAFGAARTMDGTRLTESAIAHLRCDESLRALIVDSEGVPLWLGRSTRFPTPHQRLVIGIRDGGCVFPGCDMPMSWCDVHHEPDWDHGGRSDPDAMAALCRGHHRLVHKGGWSLRLDDDQRAEFTSPTGRSIGGQRHGRTHTGTDPPQQE
ncbi:MAG TPA: DUF222 domain-containing protein [Microthrixaceae bacterium]|nr:DUF222 domain-containing protein [Microthrixaceae bacterium]